MRVMEVEGEGPSAVGLEEGGHIFPGQLAGLYLKLNSKKVMASVLWAVVTVGLRREPEVRLMLLRNQGDNSRTWGCTHP